MAKVTTIKNAGPVIIDVSRNMPGYANFLLIRMHNADYSYDRYCAISDTDNKANQLQMFRSLVQMCEEVAGATAESPTPEPNLRKQ